MFYVFVQTFSTKIRYCYEFILLVQYKGMCAGSQASYIFKFTKLKIQFTSAREGVGDMLTKSWTCVEKNEEGS